MEAGSYRTEERGTIRGYQFDKVEMVAYTKENESDAMFEELVNKARKLCEECRHSQHHLVKQVPPRRRETKEERKKLAKLLKNLDLC